MNKHTAYLSIGSNLGDKKTNLENAVKLLHQKEEIDVAAVSQFYKTQPLNFTDQEWFINAALKIKTILDPEGLLNCLKTVEKDLDKSGKPFRFGPRIIDLDIIYYENLIFKSGPLEIPHPRMHKRSFVLTPICDIGADTIHPVLKLRSDELLKKIKEQETQTVIPLGQET